MRDSWRLVAFIGLMLSPSAAWAGSSDQAVKKFTDSAMRQHHAAAERDIDSFCADKWPADYEMQNHCFRKQVAARNQAQSYELTKHRELMPIWGNCAAKWSDAQERTDWEMMAYCIKKQTAAMRIAKKRRAIID